MQKLTLATINDSQNLAWNQYNSQPLFFIIKSRPTLNIQESSNLGSVRTSSCNDIFVTL